MKKQFHCNTESKPFFKKFFEGKICHSYMTAFRCGICKTIFLPPEVVESISIKWKNAESEREQIRLNGIEFDKSLGIVY